MSTESPLSIRMLCVAVTTVAVAACAAPDVSADGFEIEHLSKLKQVTSVSLSPDGERIAYLRQVPRDPYKDENGPAWSELLVARGEDDTRRFVFGEVNVGAIDWIPDGSGISFLKQGDDDDERSLYKIPVDGGESERIVSHDTGITGYSWSPDGERVAFLAEEAEDEEREELREKGFDAEIYEEELKDTEVWIADRDDGQAEMLETPGSASEIHWSPAGDRLAMLLAPTPLVDDDLMERRVHVLDIEDGEILARFDTEGKKGGMAWSPDGEHLAWVGVEDVHDPSEGRLMVGNVDSGDFETFLSDYEGHVEQVAWTDEDHVLWLGHTGTRSELVRQHRSGEDSESLIGTGHPVLRGMSVQPGVDRIALRGDAPTHPAEIFVHEDDETRRWTNHNPWLDELELGEQYVIEYEARDGLDLEGLLILPPGKDKEDGPFPTILDIHGGPEAHYSDGWNTNYSSPGQFAANAGFAVFYPNYRGSTARGVEFSKLGQNDPAGAEFDDNVDGKEHLVEIGVADEDRVGITGGSYGGYASAWGATAQTEHFAASVMFVGISNNISKFGTSDIPNELMLVHTREWPWDNWDFYLERSPIYHAHRAETPIKILHGTADTRVHVSQSMELYRTLKVQDNVPVRLVKYPGEGHGNANAASQRDYAMRLMRWMEHYLVGPGGDAPEPELDHDRD